MKTDSCRDPKHRVWYLVLAGAALCFGSGITVVQAALGQNTQADYQLLIDRGFALHQRADYAEALPVFLKALALRPKDYFANLLTGIDLLRTHKADKAVGYLREAATQRPQEDIPLDYLGEAEASRGHYADAAEAYSLAVKVAPASSDAVEGAIGFAIERFRTLSEQLRSTTRGVAAEHRLQALSRAPDDPSREQMLETAGSMDPDSPGIWSDIALARARVHETASAKNALERALTQDPDDLKAIEARAMIAAEEGHWTLTEGDLNLIANRSPAVLARNVRDWPPGVQAPSGAVRGAAATFLGCVREGSSTCDLRSRTPLHEGRGVQRDLLFRQQKWERLIALPLPGKDDATGWFRRGDALAQVGDWRSAIPALERAQDGEADPVYSRFLLCWSYAREAGEIMQLLQQEQGDGATIHRLKGDVMLRMQGANEAAVAEYTAALQTHGNDPMLLARLAEAQFQNQQLADSEANAQAALRADPYQFGAMRTLARVYMYQRKYPEALPYLLRLSEHDPNDAAAHIELGTAMAETGDVAGAINTLAPPLAEGYPDEKGRLHALLGGMLRKAGRSAEAAKAFSEARTLSSGYESKTHRGSDEQN